MPTSNKRLPIDYEQNEYTQIESIAKSLGMSVTQFVRHCVRKEIAALGHVPSSYEYKSGQKKTGSNEMYMSIQEVKSLAKQHGFIVKDVSGNNSFGYDFAIFKAETVNEPIAYTHATGEPLVISESLYEPETINKKGTKGANRTVFNRAAVEALLGI